MTRTGGPAQSGSGAEALTLVIPAYREERRLPAYFPGLAAALADLPVELVVVDDGSPEDSFARLQGGLAPHLPPGARLLRYPDNRGKGAAIAFGLEGAAAPLLGFVDADGSVPAAEVRRLLLHCLAHPELDLVAASRVKMLGRRIDRSFRRHLTGRVFATLLSGSFGIPVYDSQCGLKVFRRERYLAVKERITDRRWIWDTELLILFHRAGWAVEEFPVDWHETPGSKIRLLRDGLRMWRGLAAFRRANP